MEYLEGVASNIQTQIDTIKTNASSKLGNREFDYTYSGYTPLSNLSTESFINHSKKSSSVSGKEGIAPNAIYQNMINYTDSDATANENFKYPINILADGVTTGYSANTSEAATQNYSNILSYVKHNVAGIVGTTCFGGRLYTPSVDDVPEIAQYGGNKCASYDGHVFTNTEYEYGGYALGAEFGIYDRVTKGTAPVYQNSDYGSFIRRTSVINVAGGGNTQPVSEGIRIMKFGSGQCGMWNGIVIGSSSFAMGSDIGFTPGTVGINMAGWTRSRGGADIGIKFATANRHLEFVAGGRIGCNVLNVYSRNTTDTVSYRLISPSSASSYMYFASSDDPTARETVDYSDNGYIGYNSNMQSINIVGSNKAIRIMTRLEDQTYHGIYIDSTNLRPINDNDIQLGVEGHEWSNITSHNLRITDGRIRIGDTYLSESSLQKLLGLI